MVKTFISVRSPASLTGTGEALMINDAVHITLKNKKYISGMVAGYSVNCGYLDYLTVVDKSKRMLIYGSEIQDISVLPLNKEKKK